jgi:predicted nuclease of predicted toxin-antitoxin system
MRVLIDSCLPVQLKAHIDFPFVRIARDMGWQNKKNGDLLEAAELSFDVLVTMDKNIHDQQLLNRFAIAVLIIKGRSNRLADLLPLASEINRMIPMSQKGCAAVIR